MKGNIYTNQECDKCGSSLRYIPNRGSLQCKSHPEVVWTGNCHMKFGRKHFQRFKTVSEAERQLNYIRVQSDNCKYDVRDWQKGNPLSFKSLREKYLISKATQEIVPNYLKSIKHVLNKAGLCWDHLSIKDIAFGEIEDFFNTLAVSNKTKSNYKSILTNFWKWVV